MQPFLKNLGWAGVYLALVSFSTLFCYGPESISVFWPGNGYLLAILLILPRERRPSLLALSVLANMGVFLVMGRPLLSEIVFSLANAGEMALALVLVQRIPGGARFLGDQAGLLRFFTTVIPVAAGVGALAGGAAATYFFGGTFPHHFATWFLVDAAGLAVMTPAVLSWSRLGFGWPSDRRHLEFGACLFFAAALAFLIFRRPPDIGLSVDSPKGFILFPFLVWAAIRFGTRGASTLVLVTYAIMAWFTSHGYGPFAAAETGGSDFFLIMHLFPYVAAICSLLPAVLFHAQKKNEQELRLREARFGNLWNSKLIGIYVADLGGIVREANDTFLAMVRHSREDLAAGEVSMLAMATPEYAAQAAAGRERFTRDGQIGPFEREWVLRDGSRLHSLVYATRMDESEHALGMVMNMEELHATQGELRRRESRYRDLLSSTLMGIFVTDLKGTIIEANDTFLGLIRRTRAELEAGAISSVPMATPEYMAGAAERRAIFQKEGRMGPYDREWLLSDGSRVNTLFFATRMEDGNALCVVIDRDELKRAQTELRVVETRFKKLFEANIVGVAVVEGRMVMEANDTFLRMVGYDRADLDARRIDSDALRGSEPIPDSMAFEASLRNTGRLDPQETVYIRKDGSLVPVYRGVARLEETGKHLVLAIDLSVLKRTQADLEKAMEASHSASRAKSDFLAHMSHEIRTPMHGVLGMVSLLQGTDLDAEQRSYARACRESGEHLLGLINQVLDFSKIESGALELDHSEFSLVAMLEGALSPLLEKAQGKGLELVKRLEPGLPGHFIGDPMRLQQILLNLIGNAVKFSDRGEVSLSVRLLERRGGRCRLVMEIADQGPGIRPETLATLFRPFRQGDDPLSRKSGGTGLGLAISKDLVGRMGGAIEVDSRPGRGSVFRFDVWLEEAERPPAKEPVAAGREPRHSAWVFEPHPDHRNQLTDLLEGWGLRVRQAGSAEELLRDLSDEAAAGRHSAVAILALREQQDIAGANGKIISAVRDAGVPVLCSLPFITQGEGNRLLRQGASGILTKPFRSFDVYNAIRTALPEWKVETESLAQGPLAGALPEWREAPSILVVDDHPVNLTVASSMLRKLGCQVEIVTDGRSALSSAAGQVFDLIFMDCSMPEMDGFETAGKLRTLEPAEKHIPIVALTAHAVKGFREKCLAEGMDDYISKPFTPEELAAVLRKWIPSGPAADAQAEPAAKPAVPTPTPPTALRGPERAESSAGPLSPADCVDWARLAMLDDGTQAGQEMVKKLIRLFLETSRSGLDAIRKEYREGRKSEVNRAIHKLKGGCGTIGATAMFRVLQELETSLAADPEDDFPAGLGRLETEFSRTHEAFKSKA